MNTKNLLTAMQQDQIVSAYTESYLIYYAPGLYIFSMCDLYRKFLNSYQLSFLPMLSFIVSVSLHPFWCQYFIFDLEMDLLGISAAGLVTNLTNFCLLLCLSRSQRNLDATRLPLSDKRGWSGLVDYFQQGMPFVFAVILYYF